jgi:hypothetical protein
VWRGAITQKHWTHEQAYLRETLKVIEGRDEEAEVQALLRLLPRSPREPAIEAFSLKSAKTRLYLLAFIDLRPRDLLSGELLDAAALIAEWAGAAVPSLAPDTSPSDPKEGSARETIFARLIQRPARREKLLETLSSLHANEAVLASVGLTRHEVELVLAGRPFAAERQRRLASQFSDFFERRARWGDSDRPSLDALILEDAP